MADFVQYLRTHLDKEKMKHLKTYVNLTLVFLLSLNAAGYASTQVKVDFGKRSEIPLFKKFQLYCAGSIPYRNFLRDFDKMSEINASSLRIDLSIGKDGISASPEVVSGTPENLKYDFKILDSLAHNLIKRNITPVYAWCYVPVPFQAGAFRVLNHTIGSWEYKWYEMHKKFAAHYKQMDLPIYHEVYNEPDFAEFLSTDTWNNYFSKMFVSAAKGLKAGDPNAVIGAPALACGPCGYAKDLMNLAKNNNIHLDFFSFHSYNNDFTSSNTIAQWLYDTNHKTTDIYIDEFNWYVPWEPGAGDAADAALNIYSAAWRTLDTFNRMLVKTRISQVHWAMYMNAGPNGIGMLNWEGNKRAVYNAFKIFADMPIDRKEFTSTNPSLKGFASSDLQKMSVVVYNTSSTTQIFSLEFNNPQIQSGVLQVYRIDSKNASLNNGATEDLILIESKDLSSTIGSVWTGEIPGEGVVYFTIKDGSTTAFDYDYRRNPLGKVAQVLHYYPGANCNSANYAEFDTYTSTAYLGISSDAYPFYQTGIRVSDLPKSVSFSFNLDGTFYNKSSNSLLGIRVDYGSGTSAYTKSVLFHGQIYNTSRTAEIPWGTKTAPDIAVSVDLSNFNVRFADYAPIDWNGRAIISYIMDDCGINTRAIVTSKITESLTEQMIQFDSIPSIAYDSHTYTMNAVSSAGLPVTFEVVDGDDIVTLDGNILTLTGKKGNVLVKAYADGNTDYSYGSAFRKFEVYDPSLPVGSGDGLSASYWKGEGVAGVISGDEQFFVDSICGDIIWPEIDYIWYLEGPGCGLGADFWSIRWQGYIQPLYSEEYIFYATIDDGVRIILDGEMIINDYPGGHALLTKTGKKVLEAGKLYPIIIDFNQWWNNAAIKFEWSSASQLREVVPQSQLYTDFRTGIKTFNDDNQISVYPNPVKDNSVFVKLKDFIGKKCQYHIFNSQGRLLDMGELKSGINILKIKDQVTNFCILKITTPTDVQYIKLIVE